MNGQRTWICSGRKFSRAAARPVKVLVVDDDVDFHRVLTHRFHLNLTHPETA
ncbi:hypothetical protein CG017_05691 (plasmid) [Burkholderia glumae]|nr:hypothetical protein KS03_5648 [Burkholderia glumae LMG 2196 = ATCC 33617]QKM57612.1 hypothetical protein CG017_05691 [Burkholderia glumae]